MASSRMILICLFASICLLKPVLLNPIPGYYADDDESNEIDDKEEILGEGDEDHEYVDDPDYKPEDDDYEPEEDEDEQDEEDEDEQAEVDEEEQIKNRKKRDLEGLADEIEFDDDNDDYKPEDEEKEELQTESRVKRDLEDSDGKEQHEDSDEEQHEDSDEEQHEDSDEERHVDSDEEKHEDSDEEEYEDPYDETYEPHEDDYVYDDYDEDYEEDFISSNKVKRDLGDFNDPEEENLKSMESQESANIDFPSEDEGGKPVIKLKDVRNPTFIDDMHKKAMEYLSKISERKND